MADELGVTIQIAGRPYRLFVRREEEETIRKASKLVDEQINQYAETYSYHDKQDLLAMAALHFATDAMIAGEEADFIRIRLQDTLTSIDETLTDTLKD